MKRNAAVAAAGLAALLAGCGGGTPVAAPTSAPTAALVTGTVAPSTSDAPQPTVTTRPSASDSTPVPTPPTVTPPPDWLGTRELPVGPAGYPAARPTPPELRDRRIITTDYLPPPTDGRFHAHAYGEAIDVNPFHNPYRSGSRVIPELATAYLDRSRGLPGMITATGPVVAAFRTVGWTWGGSWTSPKDYMHFSSTGH